ncbi:FAD-containing oxidoreductase [Caulobacter sp. ErkDOM-E]|uniref:FAD-containing oxidoreductase n=1 Tax=Caulobacter sp. ErkDOM-E TaxID=3402778 RepID=UPI003AF7C164
MIETVDVVVIGAGQAGPSLAVRFAQAGRRVVLIERERLGGTCVNNGCIPTKTLVASARAAHVARRAADFGVLTGPVSVDLAVVKARKDTVVQQSRDNLATWIGATANLELVLGEARFVGPRRVAVGDRIFEAPLVVINSGGRPVRPDWSKVSPERLLTNIEMMELDRLPRRLIVVGGSYIGLEFAQMYRRFGAEVTVLEFADRIIAREDADVSAAVKAMLEAEGVEIHVGCRDIEGADAGDGVRVSFKQDGQVRSVDGALALAAVGRRPNVEALDLAMAGVALDQRGFIQVDDTLMTSAEGVYALGDVNGRGAFTHTSYNDYEILAANLIDGQAWRLSDRVTGYALFTDPPLARVGMSDQEARTSGRRILRAELPMARIGRARERGETTGFLRVLVDAENERVLGATLFGIEADEIIHLFIQAMTANLSYKTLMRAVPVHPTVSELIPTLLGGLKPLVAAA